MRYESELTLYNGQEDDDDEEEEGDVKEDTVQLVGVAGRVLDLVPDASSGPHSHVHVEEVTLRANRRGGDGDCGPPDWLSSGIRRCSERKHAILTVIMSSHFISGSSSSSLLL